MNDVKKARKLFKSFTGHSAEEMYVVDVPQHRVVVAVGHVEAIAYRTVRDGKRERYIHEFRPKSQPILAAAPDGSQLYLIGGSYRFTDAGIVDK